MNDEITKEERWKNIEILSDLRAKYSCFEESEEPYYRALSVGIKAIREQITHESICTPVSERLSDINVNGMLNKMRAEIENHCGLTKENHCKYCSYCNSLMGVRELLEIIDKYKAESEE